MSGLIKIQVPILIQDPYLPDRQEKDLVEGSYIEREAFFDGPETARICILDDNEEFNTSGLKAVYKAPGEWSKNTTTGRYYTAGGLNLLKEINTAHKENRLEDELKLIFTSEFMQVNTFGIIEKTLDLFEEKKLIGHPIHWYSPDEKLFIHVRAEKRENLNAGYRRDDNYPHQQLRFYYKSGVTGLNTVFACLSRDIVVHETAHAIIDGINPALRDLRIFDCLAIHEALADLTALFLSFKSTTLTKEVLWENHGSLDEESQITFWAEIFSIVGQKDQRNFLNKFHLDPDISDGYCGNGNYYDYANVFSGSIFSVLINLFELRKIELAVEVGSKDPHNLKWRTKEDPDYSFSGDAMQNVLRRLPLLIYRALDYLPSAETSLADFCRAILLVDRNLFGSNSMTAGLLRKEFLKRKLFLTAQDSVVEWPQPSMSIIPVNQLAGDPKVLSDYIEKNREWLGIPADIVIDPTNCCWIMPIEPPESRTFFDSTRFNEHPQAVLKVHWKFQEEQADNKYCQAGTTVIFDLDSNEIIGRLVCAPPQKNMFVSELVQAAYEAEFARHRQHVRDTRK